MIKRILLLILTGFALGATAQNKDKAVYVFSYFKDNGQDGLHLAYSRDGLTWKALNNDISVLRPEIGKDKLMRDPCIIRGGDGNFHMVWTTGWTDKGIGYATSADLINWSDQKIIPVMEHEAQARNSWAPEITYDTSRKRYMIYWATTITGKFSETASEKESGYNHRMYQVTTKDFKKFTKTKLLYNPGFNVIDASIQKDGKKYVMFTKDETSEPAQKNIKIAYSKKLKGPYTAAGKPITGKYWAEGPTALKMDDQWIVYFDKYTLHKYGAVSSSDLVDWKDISEQISMPKGIRHGTVLTISEAEFKKFK